MSRRREYVLVCLAVFALALAMRTITLYWSPFPATLDGFDYAALARNTIATGHLPFDRLRADNLVFATVLGLAGTVTDVRPVVLAQPLIAVVGAGSCLTAVAIARRIGWRLDYAGRQVRLAAALAGLTLAVEGLYLRRTGVADEEAIGLLLVPLLAIALHRAIRTQRPAWLGSTALLCLVFPLVHTFSTLLAATTAIAVLATQFLRVPTRRFVVVGGGLVAGFWAYFALYYEAAGRLGIAVPYVGRILAHPGLFVAWLVVLVIAILWLRRTSSRLQVGTLLAAVGTLFLVLVANVFLPIFPGTATTPLVVLLPVLLFVVPVVLAGRGLPLVAADRTEGAVIVALLAAPVIQVYFALTASLTPEFFGTVMRTQTFAHFPVVVLAALSAAGIAVGTKVTRQRGRSLRRVGRTVVPTVLLVAALLTAPVAFVDLDTGSSPSTTTESEFAAASFAATHVTDRWTAADPLSRVGRQYYPRGPNVSRTPVYRWLTDGSPPTCPTLSREAWTTTGAHLFPLAPATIDETRYRDWLSRHDLVYTTSAPYRISLSLPATNATRGC
ncbi:sodium:phosphate symporter [Halococcus agarilyticus]|uniref:sodium:phosphate symporter n=1 Tax=Halococcus agarilyticus TaxID=1232219 RepID=UPI0006782271|nr:sodium:phosphate symporter [Halococcus agarilyticus]